MRKRDIRALRQAKPDRWALPGTDDESDSEGGEPDAQPYLCDCNFSAGCLECAWHAAMKKRDALDLWPQELTEQQEQQQ